MSQANPAGNAANRMSWLYLALGVLAAAIYAIAGDTLLASLMVLAIGAGSGLAIVYGIRRFRPRPAWPWWSLAVACWAFLAGIIVRALLEGSGADSLVADAFTIPGYVLMFLGLGGFLRARTGIRKHAVIDGLLIAIGATLIFTIFFAEPAATITGRPSTVSALAGVYPLLDGILVWLVLNLAFSTSRRGPAFYLFVSCFMLMLLGDVAYAVIGTSGRLTGSPLLDLPFLIGFSLIGASALHPSMVDIGSPAGFPAQPWSLRRLLLIAPALAVPFALDFALKQPSYLDEVLLAAGELLVVALLIIRAVAAVQGYAAAQHQYEHQATHDPLTGLANRSLWFEQVRRMLADATPDRSVWVYFLDLDGFKLVNDSRGHMAGDQVIAEVAQRLRQCIPPAAAIARIGGDEFVVAYRASYGEAVRAAESMLAALRQTLRMPSANVVISASMGVARSAGHTTAEDLLRDADTAMYRAKAAGRDTWVIFDPIMHDKVRERIETDLELREALATHQFVLSYQPIVRLDSGQLVGAEALIRWNHPARGVVAPNTFIPVAEESGLIVDIGRWVIAEATHRLASWREKGLVNEEFTMSINVSPRQLRDPHLAEDLSSALARFRLPGSSLAVELTESVMIDDAIGAERVMNDLRRLGLNLVVDDFGTGFSALGYLRTYPVTGVKIDRSFVAGLGTDAEDHAIVHAVVAMSAALRLRVVAEGVQTIDQRDVLQSLGVLYGQGWLWGEPVDAQTFTRLWSPAPSLHVA